MAMATDTVEVINRMGAMTFEQWGGKRQVERGALGCARCGCPVACRETKLEEMLRLVAFRRIGRSRQAKLIDRGR